MSNYKIHVKNKYESHKAQEYLFALGCLWSGNSAEFQNTHMPYLYAYMDDKVIMHGDNESKFHTKENQEVTLDQLHDLYILHRNDVNDANHSMAVASDRPDYPVFKSSESVFYSYSDNNNKWVECKSINSKTTGLKPVKKPQVQTDANLIAEVAVNNALTQQDENSKPNVEQLISGADVPRYLKNFGKIQFRTPPNGSFTGSEWKDVDLEEHEEEFTLGDLINSRYEWRLKPLILNGIEVPAPNFHHPDVGQIIFYLDDSEPQGFTGERFSGHYDPSYNYGWWDSEEKIKLVVDALQDVFKGAI